MSENRFLGCSDGGSFATEDFFNESLCLSVFFPARNDSVNESEAVCFFDANGKSRQEQFPEGSAAESTAKQRKQEEWFQTSSYFGKSDGKIIGSDDEISGGKQSGSATPSSPVRGDDDNLRQTSQLGKHVDDQRRHQSGVVDTNGFMKVETAAEIFPRGAEKQGSNGVVAGKRIEFFDEQMKQLHRKGVAPFRPLERQSNDGRNHTFAEQNGRQVIQWPKL